MNNLNRILQPEFGQIEDFNLIPPKQISLDNGTPVYYINDDKAELIRIEVVFAAGEKYADSPLVAKVGNSLIKNGTSTQNAAQIAEEIDRYGAFLETQHSFDNSSIQIHTLYRHLDKILPVLHSILNDAVYPEEEILTYLQNSKQSHLVNLEKVSFLARNEFRKLIFDRHHPYGRTIEIDDYDHVKRNDVRNFYKNRYLSGNCQVFLVGKIDHDVLKAINNTLGNRPANLQIQKIGGFEPVNKPAKAIKIHLEKEDAIQSAIRVGKLLFNRTHPDYFGMSVLNTILGGYFGSRLMSNIREDKGYTYGIGSGVVSLMDAGYFLISTEVGSEVCHDAVAEIYREIEILNNQVVPADELQLVKNYMLGSFLRSIDGAFSQIERFVAVHEFGLDFDYYLRYVETIRSITSEEIRDLAIKYLKPDSMIELTVGAANQVKL